MSYSGQYIEISDATQEALDLKSNLTGGNDIQGDQNISNGNIVIANGSYLQGKEIVGNNELYLRTLGNESIRLEPDGTGKVTINKSLDITGGGNVTLYSGSYLQGKEIVGNNELHLRTLGNENIRLEPAGTGKVTMNKSLDITGGGNVTLYGASYLQGKEIVGNNELYLRTLGNENIRLEPAGTGTITGTKDINLSAGKQYLIDGVASVGITPAQASAIVANTNKVGITSAQASAIVANTNKVGITPAQAEEIEANTDKVGITTSQASELSQNTINITALDNDKANKAGGNIFTGNQQLTSANYDIVTSGEYRKDGVNILDPYRTSAATDTLLDAKASKSASNVFDGVFNRFNTNVIVEENHFLQTAQIYGFAGLDIATSSNEDIALAPDGTGKVSSTKDIDLATGKSYKVNGTDILTPYRTSAASDILLDAKADLAGNKTFTGGNVDIEGGYLAVDDGNLFVNGATRNIQCRRIIGSSADLLIGSNIESEGDINLATGKAYKVGGTDILTPYRTSAATDLLLDDKANDNSVVKLTGDQDIDGIKTFEKDMKLESDLLFTTDDSVIKFGLDSDITLTHSADAGLTTNGTFSASQYNISGTQIASDNLSDGGSLAHLTANTFTDKQTITKTHNYAQLNIQDATLGINRGGGIELSGVYGAAGQTTAFANIKSQKANATAGNYEGNLSLAVREQGAGGYTEVIGLKGADLSAHFSGSINATGTMRAQAIPLGTGVSNQQPPTGALSGSFYKNNAGVLYVTS